MSLKINLKILNNKKFIEFIQKNIFLILIIDIILILYTFSLLGFLPHPLEILSHLEKLYNDYGLLILFIVTLIEGFLFFGLYFSGTVLIILALILANGNISEIIKIILTISIALSIINTINFIIGKYTLNSFKKSKKETSKKFIFLYFLHPVSIAYYSITLAQKGKNYSSLLHIYFGIFLAGICYSAIITILIKLF